MSRPIVTIRQGTFQGTTQVATFPQVLDVFLGVPFALPTSGERRFRPPVRVSDSTELFDASQWGQRPPSSAMANDGLPEGEDCLNLNIFRPRAQDDTRKLPVVCYFNGGAFNFGNSKGRLISSLVAWSSEPILGVSFNYRTGALGFLPSRLMAKEGLLNLGLKDQSLLLQWVRENISAFGGDPDNVTLMGHSAGAHSIGHHLMNNTSQPPLFHRVILESGAPTARCIYPYDNPLYLQQFSEFLSMLAISSLPDDQILPYLRTLPFATIRDASESIFSRSRASLLWPFQPVIGGQPNEIIPIAPIEAWHNSKWHKVPILTGYNTNEAAKFLPSTISQSSEFTEFFQKLLPALTPSDLATIGKLYPDPEKESTSLYHETRPSLGKQFKRLEAAYSQFAYIAPVRHTAHFAATTQPAVQPTNSPPPPVYLYQFAVQKSINGGADHGDHASYVDHAAQVVRTSATQAQIAGYMHAYWTSFIATGDPNAVAGRWAERPRWEPYEEANAARGTANKVRTRKRGKKMVFGMGNDEISGGDAKGIVAAMEDDTWAEEESEFWWSKVDLLEGCDGPHQNIGFGA